jgi:CheY-like chemotaxis protein
MFLWLEKKRFDLIVVGDHPPEIDACAILHRLETIRRHVPCIVMRAARVLPNIARLNELVASVSGCAGAEILKQAQQYCSTYVYYIYRLSEIHPRVNANVQ